MLRELFTYLALAAFAAAQTSISNKALKSPQNASVVVAKHLEEEIREQRENLVLKNRGRTIKGIHI